MTPTRRITRRMSTDTIPSSPVRRTRQSSIQSDDDSVPTIKSKEQIRTETPIPEDNEDFTKLQPDIPSTRSKKSPVGTPKRRATRSSIQYSDDDPATIVRSKNQNRSETPTSEDNENSTTLQPQIGTHSKKSPILKFSDVILEEDEKNVSISNVERRVTRSSSISPNITKIGNKLNVTAAKSPIESSFDKELSVEKSSQEIQSQPNIKNERDLSKSPTPSINERKQSPAPGTSQKDVKKLSVRVHKLKSLLDVPDSPKLIDIENSESEETCELENNKESSVIIKEEIKDKNEFEIDLAKDDSDSKIIEKTNTLSQDKEFDEKNLSLSEKEISTKEIIETEEEEMFETTNKTPLKDKKVDEKNLDFSKKEISTTEKIEDIQMETAEKVVGLPENEHFETTNKTPLKDREFYEHNLDLSQKEIATTEKIEDNEMETAEKVDGLAENEHFEKTNKTPVKDREFDENNRDLSKEEIRTTELIETEEKENFETNETQLKDKKGNENNLSFSNEEVSITEEINDNEIDTAENEKPNKTLLKDQEFDENNLELSQKEIATTEKIEGNEMEIAEKVVGLAENEHFVKTNKTPLKDREFDENNLDLSKEEIRATEFIETEEEENFETTNETQLKDKKGNEKNLSLSNEEVSITEEINDNEIDTAENENVEKPNKTLLKDQEFDENNLDLSQKKIVTADEIDDNEDEIAQKVVGFVDDSDDEEKSPAKYPKTPISSKSKSYIDEISNDSKDSDGSLQLSSKNESVSEVIIKKRNILPQKINLNETVTPRKSVGVEKIASSTPIALSILEEKDITSKSIVESINEILDVEEEIGSTSDVEELSHETLESRDTTLKEPNECSQEKISYSKSWSQSIKRKSDGGDIEMPFIDGFGLNRSNNKEVIKKEEKPKQNQFKIKNFKKNEYDDDEEESEENDDTDEEYHLRNLFVNYEADECSGDSMDSEERAYCDQNGIPVGGESLGSEDTEENSYSEDEEDLDSFVVTDCEEEKLSISTNEGITDESCDVGDSVVSKKKRNINKLAFSSSDEENIEEDQENLKDTSIKEISDLISKDSDISSNSIELVKKGSDDEKEEEEEAKFSNNSSDSSTLSQNNKVIDDSDIQDLYKTKELEFEKSNSSDTSEIQIEENETSKNHISINTSQSEENTLSKLNPNKSVDKITNFMKKNPTIDKLLKNRRVSFNESLNMSLLFNKNNDETEDSDESHATFDVDEDADKSSSDTFQNDDDSEKDQVLETKIDSTSDDDTIDYNTPVNKSLVELKTKPRKLKEKMSTSLNTIEKNVERKKRLKRSSVPLKFESSATTNDIQLKENKNKKRNSIFETPSFNEENQDTESISQLDKSDIQLKTTKNKKRKSILENQNFNKEIEDIESISKLNKSTNAKEEDCNVEVLSSKDFKKHLSKSLIEISNSLTEKQKMNKDDPKSDENKSNSTEHIMSRCDELLKACNEAKRQQKLQNPQQKKNKTKKIKKKDETIKDVLIPKKKKIIPEKEILAATQHAKNMLETAFKKISKVRKNIEEKSIPSTEITEQKLKSKKLPKEILAAIEENENASKLKKKIKRKFEKKSIIEESIESNDLDENKEQIKNEKVKKSKKNKQKLMDLEDNPKKKRKLNILHDNPSGVFVEQPVTPEAKKIINGFKESVITPKPLGFKVKQILSAGQIEPPAFVKPKKIKRKYQIAEPTTVLPKPKWINSTSGGFLVEKVAKQIKIEPSTSTDFQVYSLNSKKYKNLDTINIEALNFKKNALFNDRIKRESPKQLLQRKEKQKMYNKM